jgi:hypothetical protein
LTDVVPKKAEFHACFFSPTQVIGSNIRLTGPTSGAEGSQSLSNSLSFSAVA